jgi:hypothetical protein
VEVAKMKYIIIGTELYPIESSLEETLRQYRSKLRKTLGCFSTVTASGQQPPNVEVARVFKKRYASKLPLRGWRQDWAYDAIGDIARELGVEYYEGAKISAAFEDSVFPILESPRAVKEIS